MRWPLLLVALGFFSLLLSLLLSLLMPLPLGTMASHSAEERAKVTEQFRAFVTQQLRELSPENVRKFSNSITENIFNLINSPQDADKISGIVAIGTSARARSCSHTAAVQSNQSLHRIASRRIASHRVASHRIASHRD